MDVWDPQPGDRIDGKVVRVEEKFSAKYDLPYRFIPLALEDGSEVAIMDIRTVLRDALPPDLKAGDVVSVGYEGQKRSEGGRNYHDYDVTVWSAPVG